MRAVTTSFPFVLATVLATAFTALTAGCVADGADGSEKGEEEELLDDSKADSQRKPTDHGALAFGARGIAALTDTERYHAWTFELSARAEVDVATSYAVLGQRRTDTVLYLYKEGPTGWGSYIARNDDQASTTYSRLVRELGAGRYRVIVKGHLAATRGKFSVKAGCAGDGCLPITATSCLFGSTYGDIRDNGWLQTINSTKFYAATLDQLSPEYQALLVRAVQQSAHSDVTTAAEALERVDQGEMNVTWLFEYAARRSFVAFEYGAGDNSYGAVFDATTMAMVTNIHDGDLENCTVQRETCLLSDDWNALRSDPAFVRISARVITQASGLTGVEVEQAIGAFRQSYDDVTTVADGLSRVDDNQLNIQRFRHVATSQQVVVFEYRAGDTSVGAIYYPNTTQLAGVINDLAIYGCTLFAD